MYLNVRIFDIMNEVYVLLSYTAHTHFTRRHNVRVRGWRERERMREREIVTMGYCAREW